MANLPARPWRPPRLALRHLKMTVPRCSFLFPYQPSRVSALVFLLTNSFIKRGPRSPGPSWLYGPRQIVGKKRRGALGQKIREKAKRKERKKQEEDSLVVARKSRESGPVPPPQPCGRFRYCIINSRCSGIRSRERTESRKFTLLSESCYHEFEFCFLAFLFGCLSRDGLLVWL